MFYQHVDAFNNMHTNFPQWTTGIEAYLSFDKTDQLADMI